MYGSNFTGWPIQPNHISEIVKEPLWANAESILLLPFSAQSYIHIILKIAIRRKGQFIPTASSEVFLPGDS